jgi:hypothetical protein
MVEFYPSSLLHAELPGFEAQAMVSLKCCQSVLCDKAEEIQN